jgi:serine phosphatase RsbU (regulator of sigma subunit)
VGGDWYDVVELGPGRRAVVVGDCVGHGLDPAARMGQLRSAARALLLENSSPVAALDGLDRFAATLPGAECTTVFCGVVDETAGTLTYAVAGHLPPVLLCADGTVGWLDDGRGASLAMSRRPRQEVTAVVGAGDLVVLYTDGLIERRGESLREGLDRLAALVAAQDPHAPEGRIADALLDELVPHGSEDDVALVVYRVGAAAV